MPAPIYPILVNPEAFDTQKFACRQLIETDEPSVPLVAYARFDDQGQVKYTSWAALEKRGHGIPDIEKRAMGGMVNRDERPGWAPQNIIHDGQEVTILMRQGDTVVASDILDAEMVENAANFFSTDTMYVAMPTSSSMIASDQGEFIYDTMMEQYSGAVAQQLQPLSTDIFCVQNGKILGIAEYEEPPPPPPEPIRKPAAAVAAGPTAMPGELPRVQPQIFHYQDANAMWFSIPCAPYEMLCQAIQTEFFEYGPRLGNWESFQGRVVFHVEASNTRLTLEERSSLQQYGAGLTQQAQQQGWQSPYGEPVTVLILPPDPTQDTGSQSKQPPAAAAMPAPQMAAAQEPASDGGPRKRKKKKGKGKKFRTQNRMHAVPNPAQEAPTEEAPERRSGSRRKKTRGSRTRGTGTQSRAEGPMDDGRPVSIAQLRRQIPNKLGMAIWGLRIWYILLVLGMIGTGIGMMTVLNAVSKVAKEGVAVEVKDGQTGEMTETNTGGNEEIASASKTAGTVALLGCLGAALVTFLMWELVLCRGLGKLKGWAKVLGLMASIGTSLTIVGLPFGAMTLFGLVDAGTGQLFEEAKRLRQQRRLR